MITTDEIRAYINEKIPGWALSLNYRAQRRLGLCRYREKMIELSAAHLRLDSDDKVWNTITHEVAHAKVGPSHGHDWVWKAMHLSLGGNGKRCGETEVKVDAPWIGTCLACNAEIPRLRMSAKALTQKRYHTACGDMHRQRLGITWKRVR